MKKIFKMILLSVSFAAMIFGCAKFDNNVDGTKTMNSNGEYAIMFSNSPSTKATVGDNGVATYNEFALYTWNSNAEVIMNPYIVKKDGNAWKYDGAADGQTVQYFKNNADNYNFIGVIPTAGFTFNENKVTGNVKSFTIDDSRVNGTITTDSPNEFLYAYKNVEKADYKNDVTLDFKHGNALLYLGFISDDGNTQIIDYTASSTTVNTITKITAPINRYGIVTSSNFNAARTFLTDDVIEEFNAKCNITELDGTIPDYTTPDTWGNISSTKPKKIVTGDLNNNRWNEISSLPGYTANLFNSLVDVKAEYARPVHIEAIGGEIILFYVANIAHTNAETIYEEETITTGLQGIRVFSAKADATNGYAHVEHTMTADATVSTDLSFDNRVTSSDVIQFSLPTSNVPVGTTEADAIYSPTTFYAIPGDTDLTHFVVKVSYEYKGEKVYDVRVPIELPAAGLEAGKYYKYIINITSTGNGTNDPSEADPDKGEIDIVNNPIVVTVDVTDYGKGDVKIITI